MLTSSLLPRMPADETPTHYACTLERLLRGQRCTYEFSPQPAARSDSVARDNSQEKELEQVRQAQLTTVSSMVGSMQLSYGIGDRVVEH